MRPDAVLIAGPTASGKSSLAMALAGAWNGCIINADSMQVYRQMRILTARPGAADMKAVPHALFGHVSVVAAYSVGHWLQEARSAAAIAWENGQVPVFVGGTGLYFRALEEGLARIPDVPPAIVAHWRDRLAAQGPAALYEVLSERDPDLAARLSKSDGQRIVRALAVLQGTGKSLRAWQEMSGTPGVLGGRKCLKLVLVPDRPWLHRRIDERFEIMLVQGAWEEVRNLAGLAPDRKMPAMKAIGVRDLMRAVNREIDPQQAVTDAKTATRRYAKRQDTWFRHQMAGWQRLPVPLGNELLDRLMRGEEFPLDPGSPHD